MEKLNVYFNNQIVGYLARYENKYAFEYDSDWLMNGFSISPFSLPLKIPFSQISWYISSSSEILLALSNS